MTAAPQARSFGLSFTDGRAWALHERRMAARLRRVPLAGFTAAGWHTAALQRGRHNWTLLSLNEYRAASTLAYMAHLLALAGAPLDLVSLASTLPQQELAHAEICARVAGAMGGATHLQYLPASFPTAPSQPDRRSVQDRAAELVIAHCCVAETLSFRLLLAGLRHTQVPLLRAALRALAREEALHSELGWLFLDWYVEHCDAAGRARLGRLAAAAALRCRHVAPPPDAAAEADSTVDARALDWISPAAAADVDAHSIATCVRAPLATYDIAMPLLPDERGAPVNAHASSAI